ncbi:helix-turn-helix transcriptional regulator [Paenibacillus piri]|uniref:AraC family transcriptional regulator n=1 Tax=Paenibacillus piri TaxID=2547395 RepID=A0A4R5KH71_9BACL|nr:helix-turn-helix transcriptional regulator [Paenibacillus piri]TDF94733.1 AraC family transcriptional regulator [Paenibacillus piri]
MLAYSPLQPSALQSERMDAHFRYREFPPGKSLEPYVACYWTIDADATDQPYLHRIIPDGCADIIFDLRARSFSTGAFVAGLMTAFAAMNLESRYSLFGIRFYSENVRRFFIYPVSELTGYHVLLEDIWGKEAGAIAEQVISADGTSEMIERVESFLSKALLQNETNSDQLLQSSMQYIYASQGMMPIRDLAEQLCYSERNIRRTFQKELGVSPKELSGIIRFQCLLQELYHGAPSRFTDIAVKYGYFDQSHLINSFKRFYGLAPGQVFR